MADLIQKNNEPSAPEANNSKTTIAAIVFLAITLFSGVLFVVAHSYVALGIAGIALFICFVLFAWEGTSSSYTPESKRYGNMGERKTGTILERYLPEGYTIIQNPIVTYDGKSSEIDNVIVGTSGVFIVEVKNVKGTVTGDYEWQYWLQNKTDQYGIKHQKEFYNPVKQTGTHIFRLANFLRDNKIFTHISGAVYFANPRTDVFISGEVNDIPVFTYQTTEALLQYIENGTVTLSKNTIQRIIQVLS